MIRGVTLLAVGSACLALGLRAAEIQVANFELAAALDARQRRLDLEWMAVLGAEAGILARESVLESSRLASDVAPAQPRTGADLDEGVEEPAALLYFPEGSTP